MNTIQELFEIEEIRSDYIELKNDYIMILKVEPINFNLKTDLERKAILENFKLMMLDLVSEIQIKIEIGKIDINSYLSYIKEKQVSEEYIIPSSLYSSYIELIKNILETKDLVKKDYYIIIRIEKKIDALSEIRKRINKIKNNLEKCGNISFVLNKDEILKIMENI